MRRSSQHMYPSPDMPYSDSPNSHRRRPLAAVSHHLGQELDNYPLDSEATRPTVYDPSTGVPLLSRSKSPEVQQHERAALVEDRSIYAKYFTDWWLLEILCWLIASASVGAIITILYLHDGKSIPQWRWNISINTAIATFSTIAKGALMVPVASCLSQLKWLWLSHHSKRLGDLQEFDDASRGAIGSIILLGKLKGGFLGVIGAAITILALAASPATQQLITFESSGIEVPGVASMPRCQNFTGGDFIPNAEDFDDSFAYPLTQVFFTGLLSPVNTVFPQAEPSCSTGNCTWDIYHSVGVCASVADVTDQLSDTWSIVPAGSGGMKITVGSIPTLVNVTGWFLPNGAGVLNSILNLTSNGPALLEGGREDEGLDYPPAITSLAFSDVLEPISDFFITYTIPAPEINGVVNELPLAHMAFECVLQFCIQSYSTNTVNGVSTTNITSSFINNTYASEELALATPEAEEYNTNGSMFGGKIYAANIYALFGMQKYFSNSVVGSYGEAVGTSNGDPNIESDGGLSGTGSGNVTNPVWTTRTNVGVAVDNISRDSYGEPGNDNAAGLASRATSPGNVTGELWAANASTTTSDVAGGMFNAIGISSDSTDRQTYLNNTKAMMNNIATSLTNNIRQSADHAEFAIGKSYQDQTTVMVHWLWIIFPGSLLFLSLLLLVGTMIYTSQAKTGLWKSSVMALLQGLSDDGRRELGGLEYTSILDNRAKTIEVSLEREGEGWKLLRRLDPYQSS